MTIFADHPVDDSVCGPAEHVLVEGVGLDLTLGDGHGVVDYQTLVARSCQVLQTLGL